MLRISVGSFQKLYSLISEKMPLYLPIEKAGQTNYGLYTDDAKVDVFTVKTNKSPKDLFFPQSEDLVEFVTEGKTLQVNDIRKESSPFVLFGVRACDFKAFEVLDRVFINEQPDTYYMTKREAGIVVTLACYHPEESCFCKVFGIDATNPLGDVTTWFADNYLYWQPNTEKGNSLTAEIKDLFEESDDEAVNKQRETVKGIIEKLPYVNLSLEEFKKDDYLPLFNSEKWASLSEACIGCGTCTFVCPTCQCYDIRDFKANGKVKRFRCWDSCMYTDFTKMAGGNPRTTQLQRYRQRFMHKLVYYPKNNEGLFSCVGCGRCVNKCPQKLNIVKVIKTFGGNVND